MNKKTTLSLLFVFILLINTAIYAQENVSYDGAEWHRKENREEVARIFNGEVDLAIENMQARLADQADKDPELFFGLALAFSEKTDADKSLHYFEAAIEKGFPVSRFMVHLPGLEALHNRQEFLDYIEPYTNKTVHGPRLGAITDSSCKIWLRTWKGSEVKITFYSDQNAENQITERKSQTSPQNDFTTVVDVDDLAAATQYYYDVTINGIKSDSLWVIKTLPEEEKPGIFTIGFGACSAYNPEFERIWDTIAKHDLDMFLALGDNVYANHPELPDIHRFCYYQRQSRPEFTRLTSSVPYIGIWDDHDFGENDSYGGPDKHEPAWKGKILEVFKENFANPYYATDGLPGVWFDFKIGDVHFFMLDGRYYREASYIGDSSEDVSMLGPHQKEWLKHGLESSESTFKVIVSPVPWADEAKGEMTGRYDHWGGYRNEREEIFSFLAENEISGVILLSGDRHRHDAWKHERKNGYDLYEFNSARLTNIHFHRLMPDAMFGYNEKNGFAKLIFNTQAEQPHMIYKIYSIDNELIQMIRVYLHQLI
jgi:alkaline phosphatase D